MRKMLPQVRTAFASAAVIVGSAQLAGCGGGVGACVSDPVEFQQIGLRVYCYENWEKADCDENQAAQVNGADWNFHSGQTCSDRGFDTGSNPYP